MWKENTVVLEIQKQTEIPSLVRPKVLLQKTSVSYEFHTNRCLLASLFSQKDEFRNSLIHFQIYSTYIAFQNWFPCIFSLL